MDVKAGSSAACLALRGRDRVNGRHGWAERAEGFDAQLRSKLVVRCLGMERNSSSTSFIFVPKARLFNGWLFGAAFADKVLRDLKLYISPPGLLVQFGDVFDTVMWVHTL